MPATATAPCPHGYHYRPLCRACGSTGVTADVQGATLPQPAPGAATAASALTTPWTGEIPAPPVAVPGYELLEELGRGGMGVVYKGRQLAVGRVVALKMILSGELAGSGERERFRAEAEAVARLQHPNIVQLYEYGEAAGRPYFSLEFVGGGSLASHLDGTPRPADQSAELVETLARAMHYAHSQGVVHRDLKPANILLQRTEDGGQRTETPKQLLSSVLRPLSSASPKVSDFGLAKRLDSLAGHTRSGDVLGTPSYMAPEQAAGRSKEVGPATDVYALGAILYELLTGRPPFRGATPLETIVQVTRDEPVPPRHLRPDLPRDLETVVLKCLAKEPGKRYESATALAEDLRRWHAGEPVAARPAGTAERLVKWVRRRPAVAALYAVTFLTGALLITVGLRNHAILGAAFAQTAAERDRATSRLVRLTVTSGNALYDQGERLLALPWFAEALRLEQDNPARAAVHRTRLAAALRQCPDLTVVWLHAGRVTDAAMSPDGRLAATAGGCGGVSLREVGRPDAPPRLLRGDGEVRQVTFDAAGGRLLVLAGGRATVHDLTAERSITLAHPGDVTQADWSADGREVVTVGTDGVARVWEAATGEVRSALEHPGAAGVAARSDGAQVVTGAADGSVRVWDVAAGRVEHSFTAPGPVTIIRYGPKGDRLLAAGGRAARVWNLADGRSVTLEHAEAVTDATFSPDGVRVATASLDDSARIWDAMTGRQAAPTLPHGSDVYWVTFSPDGSRVASGGDDDTARVWDAATGSPLSPPLSHAGGVVRGSFSRDGRSLLTASGDRTARLWALRGAAEVLATRLDPLPLVRGAVSRSGRYRLAIDDDAGCTAYVWDDSVNRVAPGTVRHGSRINFAAFGPDETRLVTASDDNMARVWDVASGAPITPPLSHHGSVERVVFSTDGGSVLTASRDGAAWVWDATTGEVVAPVPRLAAWVVRALAGEPGPWDLPTDDRPVEQLEALAQWLSGHRVDATGGLVPLSNDELKAAGERARASAPRPASD